MTNYDWHHDLQLVLSDLTDPTPRRVARDRLASHLVRLEAENNRLADSLNNLQAENERLLKWSPEECLGCAIRAERDALQAEYERLEQHRDDDLAELEIENAKMRAKSDDAILHSAEVRDELAAENERLQSVVTRLQKVAEAAKKCAYIRGLDEYHADLQDALEDLAALKEGDGE